MALNKEDIYYVYEWYNIDTQEVFYVGKGKNRRYVQVKGRNQYFLRYYDKYDCAVRKIKTRMSEDDAYALEVETIKMYKDIGQCVCNFSKGGQGGASDKNLSEDTYMLKTVSRIINNSTQMVGCKGKPVYYPVPSMDELAVINGLMEFTIYTSEEYYALDRDTKLIVAKRITEIMEENDYDYFVKDLVEDGAYSSFDEYWEHIYKY